MKVNKKKTVLIIFLILVVFICGNAFAALIGAPNIFFSIKDMVVKQEVKGKDNLLSDSDIAIANPTIKENKDEDNLSETDKIFKDLISEYEGSVYEDSWNIKYDIKSIESVKTEFSVANTSKYAELYKCYLTYKTSDGKIENAELAMIKEVDSDEGELCGTYLNFTGTTRFTRFVGLYQEDEEEIQDETDQIPEENIDEIVKSLFEKGSQKIRETHYTDYYQYEVVQPIVEKTINGVTYQKRDVLYDDVEKEYSEIFTGEALENVLGKRFIEIDGYLYVSYGGATGWDVTNIKVSKVSENNNEIEYTVRYNDVRIDDSITEEYSCKMIVKLVDGDYRISNINYCNIDNNV